MLSLVLDGFTDNEVTYNYYPENKSDYGILIADRRSGKIKIVKIANSDHFRRYLFHAVSRIEKYLEKSDFLENDIVAWN